MTLHSITRGFIPLTLAAGLAGFTNLASATVLKVDIDTSSLAGTTGQLAFDLSDGDSMANNSVTITAFNTDGALGAATTSGGVTGALPGAVTLTDTDFFNELLQPITFVDSIRFTLTLTDNYDPNGSFPDQFALFLVDFSSPIPQPLFGTSGSGALFAIDLGVTGGLQIYQATATPAATWTVTNAAIPEPGVLLLFGSGLLGLAGCRRWR